MNEKIFYVVVAFKMCSLSVILYLLGVELFFLLSCRSVICQNNRDSYMTLKY